MSPGNGRRRRRLPGMLGAMLALATSLLPAGLADAPALARQGAPAAQAAGKQATPAVTAKLESISTWTGPARPLRVELTVANRGEAALGDLQVRLFADGPLNSRSELQERLTAQARSYDRFVGTRRAGGDRRVAPGATLRLPAQSFELPADLAAGHAGAVIPIGVEVTGTTTSGGVESARIDTFAVYVSERVAQPLRMSMIVQLHEPSHRAADGAFVDDGLAALLAAGGPLGNIVRVLDQQKEPPVDLMVDALLVEEATAMSGNGWRLREDGSPETEEVPGTDPRSKAAFSFNQELGVLAGKPGMAVYALPYAGADLVALTRSGLAGDAAAQIRLGRSELEQRLGTAPDRSLAFPFGGLVDRPTLRVLDQAGASTVVLSGEQVPGSVPRTRTPNAPVDLTAAGQPLDAVVADPALSAALADPQALKDPAERAQRIIAETAATWLEQPNRKEPRGILLAPPGDWRPSPRLFSTLVNGFADAPWLRMVRTERLTQEVGHGTGKRATLGPYTQRMVRAELPGRYLSSIRGARTRLQSFVSSAGESFEGGRELERLLLVAESTDYRVAQARARGSSYVKAVNDRIRGVYADVGIEPTPVVLTARQGPLQITAFNRSDVPLKVRLRVSSGWIDATEPVSQAFELPAGGVHTRRVEVRTRGTGNHPVQVELITADQREVIGTGSVMVRSTAVARVTLLLIGGAGGFLVFWWARKPLKRRRDRRTAAGRGAAQPDGARRPAATPARDAGIFGTARTARAADGDGTVDRAAPRPAAGDQAPSRSVNP